MLLKRNAQLEHLDDQQNSFQKLKQKLMSKSTLQYPDITKELIVAADTRNEGIRAVYYPRVQLEKIYRLPMTAAVK
jgi:hypothetical protein